MNLSIGLDVDSSAGLNAELSDLSADSRTDGDGCGSDDSIDALNESSGCIWCHRLGYSVWPAIFVSTI